MGWLDAYIRPVRREVKRPPHCRRAGNCAFLVLREVAQESVAVGRSTQQSGRIGIERPRRLVRPGYHSAKRCRELRHLAGCVVLYCVPSLDYPADWTFVSCSRLLHRCAQVT